MIIAFLLSFQHEGSHRIAECRDGFRRNGGDIKDYSGIVMWQDLRL